jgi:hypothetical protein
MTNHTRMLNDPAVQPNCGRSLASTGSARHDTRTILAVIVIAPAAAIGLLFFGAPHSWADSTDSGIGHNPGLQVNCAFNPAFAKAHPKECKGIDVEAVASNGGADPAESTVTGKTRGVS